MEAPPDSTQALVLVAEDEAEIAQILMAYLARSGLRVAHAADGQAALDMHHALKPDLVLLDVMMPRLDGWAVLSEIRRRGHTAVIMLTAMDQDIDKLTGLRIGADDYIVKPFHAAEVVARSNWCGCAPKASRSISNIMKRLCAAWPAARCWR